MCTLIKKNHAIDFLTTGYKLVCHYILHLPHFRSNRRAQINK